MKVIAILSSDWHLSSKAPIARSAEPDWNAAMKRTLNQISELSRFYDRAMLICAGDYFHHWNSSAELINFAIHNAPEVYGIPGQHDLPNHNYDDIRKSAYWTMVQSGKIRHLSKKEAWDEPEIVLHPFAWGSTLYNLLPPNQKRKEKGIHLAVVHKYIWSGGANYPGSKQEDHVKEFNARIKGFDAAVVGDNHVGFDHTSSGVTTFNCGSLMSRNIDQRNHRPRVGLLREDGTIESYFLDTAKDQWLATDQIKKLEEKVNLSSLLKEFKKVSANTINFLDVLETALKSNEVSEDAKGCLNQILEEVKC